MTTDRRPRWFMPMTSEELVELARRDPSYLPNLEVMVQMEIELYQNLRLPLPPALRAWQERHEGLPPPERLSLVGRALRAIIPAEKSVEWPPDPPGPRVLH